MARIEINLLGLELDKIGFVESILKKELEPFHKPFFVDDKLLFWAQHFNTNKYSFATYQNGHVKGGTLRYGKEGSIRIPKYVKLPVYESNELKQGMPPRAFVHLAKLVVASPLEFKLEELQMDGFESHKEMIEGMQSYYPDVNQKSVLSFYFFDDDTQWRPNKDDEKRYFDRRKV